MAREKKLTVKLFENKLLSKNKDVSGPWHPLYLNVIFNKKVTTLKSPSFDFIQNLNMYTDWILYEPEIIENNDMRLLKNIRSLYEKQEREFSVLELKQTNKEFAYMSSTLFDAFENDFKMSLFSFFHDKKGFVNTEMMAVSSFNFIYFIDSVKELNSDIYQEIVYQMPTKFRILDILINILDNKTIPFIADFLNDEPFTNELKALNFDIYLNEYKKMR